MLYVPTCYKWLQNIRNSYSSLLNDPAREEREEWDERGERREGEKELTTLYVFDAGRNKARVITIQNQLRNINYTDEEYSEITITVNYKIVSEAY